MIEHLDYTISRDPFSSKTLSALHWECFQSIKDGKLSSFFEEKQKDLNEFICVIKCLSELESLGLIQPVAPQMRYDAWKSSQKLSDKVEVKASTEATSKKEDDLPAPKATAPMKAPVSLRQPEIEVIPAEETTPEKVEETEVIEVLPDSQDTQEPDLNDSSQVSPPTELADSDESIDVKEVQRKKRGETVSLDL